MTVQLSIDDARSVAADVSSRLDDLAALTEVPGQLTRRYLTPEHARASALVQEWMHSAGMQARVDAAGNVIGRYEGSDPERRALLLGSHLDTVRDAGKFDGGLGVTLPIRCIEHLHAAGLRLQCPVEVVAFGDEEGVRFASTYLGSRAMSGQFDHSLLERRDEDGVALSEAMTAFGLDPERIGDAARSADDLAAYVEIHIEQGPVLESEGLPVGVVTSIAGATRLEVTIEGEAGHAGTVPMGLRRDALAGAAESILLIEKRCEIADLVGTVGQIEAHPGAINVIPGLVGFSVDIRSGKDIARTRAVDDIRRGIDEIAARRRLSASMKTTHSASSVSCDPVLSDRLAEAVVATGCKLRRLPSGAGHDAAAMAALTPAAMLFVRCWRGISHHPDESMAVEDIATCASVLVEFLGRFASSPAA